MKYIVYRTTCVVTGEFYIGVHGQTVDDSYLGSGLRLKRLVAKYGKPNFERVTLYTYSTEAEAFAKEVEVIAEYFSSPLNVNISPGGDGGAMFKGKRHTESTRKLLSEKSTGRVVTEDTRAKLSEVGKRRASEGKLSLNWGPGPRAPRSEETKKKLSLALKGGTREHSELTRQRMSESAIRRYEGNKLEVAHGSAACYQDNNCRNAECTEARRLYKNKIILRREIVPYDAM